MTDVFWSPITAITSKNMSSSKSPGTIVVGQPGSGKSFTLINIAANSLEQGCNVFALDAKDDLLVLKRIFPDMKTTDVNKISAGALDPFAVFDDVEPQVITTVIEIICGKLDSMQKLAITPIISDFITKHKASGIGRRVTFRDFADYLYQNENDNARAIGNQLLLAGDSTYGKLLFAEPGTVAKTFSMSKESRIISILGMNMPLSEAEPKPDEAINLAIIYIICKMIKDLLTRSKKSKPSLFGKKQEVDKTPTVLILDEAHILMKSQAISSVIDELLVLGRSLGIAVVLASQNVTHFPTTMSQHLSTKICFKMSKSEAEEFFDMFNNSSSTKSLDVADVIETVTRLNVGYCVMIDSSERCGLVHVTSNYDTGDITSNPLFKKR